MGSTRLPGKVLADVHGRPMLGLLLERLTRVVQLSEHHVTIAVATSDLAQDDPVAALAKAMDVAVVRGAERDVLARFELALDQYPSADTVVRLTGDCPLLDPVLVAEALDLHANVGADYTSNTLVRTYPDGLDVEVIAARALRAAAAEATDRDEREHVTPFVYRRPARFELHVLRGVDDLGDERWTIDTPDDLDFLRTLVRDIADPITIGWRDVLALAGRRARTPAGALRLRPATIGDARSVFEWRNEAESVRYSRTGEPVDWETHRPWFESRLTKPSTRMWIATVDARPVGNVRVDVDQGVGLVSISVAAESRGRGLAVLMLRALQRALTADLQVTRLTAEIHEENEPSLRSFRRAGFEFVSQDASFLVLEWKRA